MKYDRAILVDNINILINDNNITQSDLAKIIGTHQSRLSECLSKNFVYCDISHCDIDTACLPSDLYEKLERGKLNGISIDENTCPEFIGIPSLSFLNESIINFLNEWDDAMSLFKFDNGIKLYETWKEGILAKYKNHLKIYQYKTKEQYMDRLIEEKYNHCVNGMKFKGHKDLDDFLTNPTLKADWKELSESFNKTCSDNDRKLLEQCEDEFDNWDAALPLIPDYSSLRMKL